MAGTKQTEAALNSDVTSVQQRTAAGSLLASDQERIFLNMIATFFGIGHILSGSTAPGSALGNVGNFYLQTTTAGVRTLFGPKTSTGWGTGKELGDADITDIHTWARATDNNEIPVAKVPTLTDGKIPAGITRDNEVEGFALRANSGTDVPDSKIPAGITRDNELEGFALTANPNSRLPLTKLPMTVPLAWLGTDTNFGSAAPSNADGNNGDRYIQIEDSANRLTFYRKASGAWSSALTFTASGGGGGGGTAAGYSEVHNQDYAITPNRVRYQNGMTAGSNEFTIVADKEYRLTIFDRNNASHTKGGFVSQISLKSNDLLALNAIDIDDDDIDVSGSSDTVAQQVFKIESGTTTGGNFQDAYIIARDPSNRIMVGAQGTSGGTPQAFPLIIEELGAIAMTGATPATWATQGNNDVVPDAKFNTGTRTNPASGSFQVLAWDSNGNRVWHTLATGGTTPMPSHDFVFGYRLSATSAYVESNQVDDVPFTIQYTTIGTTNPVTYRVPDTHQISAIRNSVLGSLGTNELTDWTSAVSGGFRTYTRTLNGGLNTTYQITVETV